MLPAIMSVVIIPDFADTRTTAEMQLQLNKRYFSAGRFSNKHFKEVEGY